MEINEAIPEYKRYTYADYCEWDDDKRWELIDGVPYAMAAPSLNHQEVLLQLASEINNFLIGKLCRVIIAPFDVRLNADYGDDTVVQPDLLVVCDMSKLNKNSCVGAPDMVVEIISQSSSMRDRFIKFNKYLKAGVREYWIIEPESKLVSIHLLRGGQYYVNSYSGDDVAPVHVLDGCTINLAKIFTE